jgi:hypothetical protein
MGTRQAFLGWAVKLERFSGLRACAIPRMNAAPGVGVAFRVGVAEAQPQHPEEAGMTSSETGQVTGTRDKDYDIIWFTEACLSNALRLETYIQDAEREGDTELATFFRKAQAESRKGAEQGKQLLRERLGRETGTEGSRISY